MKRHNSYGIYYTKNWFEKRLSGLEYDVSFYKNMLTAALVVAKLCNACTLNWFFVILPWIGGTAVSLVLSVVELILEKIADRKAEKERKEAEEYDRKLYTERYGDIIDCRMTEKENKDADDNKYRYVRMESGYSRHAESYEQLG